MSQDEEIVEKIKEATQKKGFWGAIFNIFGFGGTTIEYLFKIILSLLELIKIVLVIGGIGIIVYILYFQTPIDFI